MCIYKISKYNELFTIIHNNYNYAHATTTAFHISQLTCNG